MPVIARILRTVSEDEWQLSGVISSDRRERLLNPPAPDALLERVFAEAAQSCLRGEGTAAWEPSEERAGYHRIKAEVAIQETTFDQLFNGRSGYRAQYYLSPEEGILYNRDVLEGLTSCITELARKLVLSHPDRIRTSLLAPHSKIWVVNERQEFENAESGMILARRWVENKACLGCRAPLPRCPRVDVKGAFVDPHYSDVFVDDLKLDRAWDLHRKGFT